MKTLLFISLKSVIFSSLVLFFRLTVSGETHVPEFSVKEGKKGGYELYDGKISICEVRKDGAFVNIRIAPDKPRTVALGFGGPWHTINRQHAHWDKLEQTAVVNEKKDKITVKCQASDSKGKHQSKSTVVVTYDPSRQGYFFDFRSSVKTGSEVGGKYHPAYGIRLGQYADPWFIHSRGPSVPFKGMWKKQYHYFFFKGRQCYFRSDAKPTPLKGYIAAPFNRSPSKASSFRWYLEKEGIMGVIDSENGNVGFKYFDDTALNTQYQFCTTGYDFHHFYIYKDSFEGAVPRGTDTTYTIPTGTNAEVHVQMFRLTDQEVEQVKKSMKKVPFPERWVKQAKDYYPIFSLKNRFDKPLLPSTINDGDLDPWPWEPFACGRYCKRDLQTGYQDKTSVKITNNEPAKTYWKAGTGWSYCGRWEKGKRYFFKGMVKTDNVTGKGAGIVVRFFRGNKEKFYQSKMISGTKDWTPVSLGTDVPPDEIFPGPSNCQVRLQLDGTGTVWFDDVEFGPVE